MYATATVPTKATSTAGESRNKAGTTNRTSTPRLNAKPTSARTPWRRPNAMTTAAKAISSHSSGVERW